MKMKPSGICFLENATSWRRDTICEAELQATVLNYGQGIFEGLKAQEVKGIWYL